MENKSLLEKALAVRTRRVSVPVGPEELELALAFLKGKVTTNQYAKVLEIGTGSVASMALSIIRNASMQGMIEIRRVGKELENGK